MQLHQMQVTAISLLSLQAIALAQEPIECPTVPTEADFDRIYIRQVSRLEDLLTGSDEVIAANKLLRGMLGSVAVRPDEEADDGLFVEIRSSMGHILQADPMSENANGLPKEAILLGSKISVVAGVRHYRKRTIAIFHV